MVWFQWCLLAIDSIFGPGYNWGIWFWKNKGNKLNAHHWVISRLTAFGLYGDGLEGRNWARITKGTTPILMSIRLLGDYCVSPENWLRHNLMWSTVHVGKPKIINTCEKLIWYQS